MFSTTPTLDQLTSAIYRNSTAMRSLSDHEATLRIPDVMIPLKASILLERPRRVRIRGEASAVTGKEIDLGSNDDHFWIWAKRIPERHVYYCRHDQFVNCPVRQMVPIDPAWILEAMGMIDFQADETHNGPFPVEGDKLMFETLRPTPAGTVRKRTTVDPKSGCILRQEMYSPNGTLAAVAVSSNHEYDSVSGILYARHVEVQCQGASGSISIDLKRPKFNLPISSNEFTKPSFPGYTEIDICSPQFINMLGTVPPTASVTYQPPAASPYQTPYQTPHQPSGSNPTADTYARQNAYQRQTAIPYQGTNGNTPAPIMGASTQLTVR